MDFEDKLYQARISGSLGDFDSARAILKEILDEDVRNIDAWLLLADVVDKPEFSLKCLQRVLKLDPENEIAAAKLTEWQAVQDVTLEGEHWSTTTPERAAGPERGSDISPASSIPALMNKPARRKHVGFVLIGGLVICAVILAGFLFLLPGVVLTQQAASAAEGPPIQEVTSVIFENIRASNVEDPELYMATIHSESPGYQQTMDMLASMFETYDLSYQISDLSITSQKDNEAVVAFVLTTRKLQGPEFRDNEVSGEMILRLDEGEWKIFNQTVDEVEYLE